MNNTSNEIASTKRSAQPPGGAAAPRRSKMIVENVQTEAKQFLDEKKSAADIDKFILSAALTETGNAECFEAKFGADYRFNATLNQWLKWNGVVWQVDLTGKVDDDILTTVRYRRSLVASKRFSSSEQMREKNKSLTFLLNSENMRSRKNIKQAAQLHRRLVTKIDDYDTSPDLASTLNGTIDLSSGVFRAAERRDYITTQFGTVYDEKATCPRWHAFLQEVFAGDVDLIRFIQKIIGYSLTGSTAEQKMFIFYGFGKNGKTVLINTIDAMLGGYAGKASFKTFDADKKNEQTNDLAALKGKRFVSMVESGADRKLNEPLIKEVTGGDKISCRLLYKESFEYFPQFKLFLATNHKPVITRSDYGIWRRIVLIPFTQNFEGKDEDKGLIDKLRAELPGILNWALEGLKLWRLEGLRTLPDAIDSVTEAYKDESDTVGQWREARTEHVESPPFVQALDAYTDYKNWAEKNHLMPFGIKAFKAELEQKGYVQERKSEAIFWQNLDLKA